MIKINLLPVPKKRKAEALILQSIIGILVLGATAMGCYFVGSSKKVQIDELTQQIGQKRSEIEQLKAKVGEVDRYKKQAQSLQEQLGIIRALEAGRTGPVKMLDELTELVPKKLYLLSYREAGDRVTLEGQAESGPVIADFLENIKTSKYFSNPTLTIVTSSDGSSHKFTISVNVKYNL